MERDFARPYYEPPPVDENPRPPRSGKRAALLLLVALVISPILLFGSRLLLANRDYGTVTFSNTASDCTVGPRPIKFSAGSTVYGLVILERGVSPGEVLTVRLLEGDVVLATQSFTVEGLGMCGSQPIDDGSLPPGSYQVTYSTGDELLAQGTFEVT